MAASSGGTPFITPRRTGLFRFCYLSGSEDRLFPGLSFPGEHHVSKNQEETSQGDYFL